MKFAYKFNNLLGSVYRKGGLLFTPDGYSVISTVGNRISVFDLKNNKSSTLPIESRFNYVAVDLSPNGCTLIAINEEGEAHMISLISQTIVHRYRFKGECRAVRFSPDGKHFAVCKDNNVFVFKAPGPFSGQYNAFVMEKVFHGANDETTCLDWSSDSKILAVGSKDMATKLYPLDKCKNFRIYSLGNHTDGIVGCFFEKDSYDILTISRNGQTCVWDCTIEPSDMQSKDDDIPVKKKKSSEDDFEEEDDIDVTKAVEKNQGETEEALKNLHISYSEKSANKETNKLFYKRIARHYLADEARKDNKDAVLTSAAYHKQSKILVTGYSSGAFFIYEAPDMSLIHSLSISEHKISSIALNQTGEWIALGCTGIGMMLVWEWQSETYVLKQQGHANNMTCVSYSADGRLLATGGLDGKVKLWKVDSGLCFVTFNEHSSSITALSFSGTKNFLVSASLDGTIRAYDLMRYRNFKTFTSPRPVQFACVAVDINGEFVAAGGQDVFEIYLWSVKTGRLLEILPGHEGPVASLAFSRSLTSSTTMASVSWDKTLRIWDAIEKGSAHETIELSGDGLWVTFSPAKPEVAVATLDGQISVFDIKTASQVVSIEGKHDLGSGRSDTDLITAKKSLEAKSFSSICYSGDGVYVIAAGQSKNVCIYNVQQALLIKKFKITQNRSLDAVDDFINRRKLTEFGNLALIEEREEREGGNVAIKLPGVRQGDLASRVMKPEVRVFCLQFSPTGNQWAAATTEGLLTYSLNTGMVFDPWNLEAGTTPITVRRELAEQNYLNALTMALHLNEKVLIQEVIEKVPLENVSLIISQLSSEYIQRLLLIVSDALDNSKHFEYYLHWVYCTLSTVFNHKITGQNNMSLLIALEKSLSRRKDQISKIFDFNKYTMEYVTVLGKIKLENQLKEEKPEEERETESESSADEVENDSIMDIDDF